MTWSDDVDAVLAGDLVTVFAYLTPARGVVLSPVTTIGLRDRAAGTVSMTTSLGFARKLDRLEREPRCAFAFHTREHGFAADRPEALVLVQGRARFSRTPDRDALEALLPQVERFMGEQPRGRFWDWMLREYRETRVLVHVDVEHVHEWPAPSGIASPAAAASSAAAEAPPTAPAVDAAPTAASGAGDAPPTATAVDTAPTAASGAGDAPPTAAAAAAPPAPQKPPRDGVAPRVDAARVANRLRTQPHRLAGWRGANGFPVAARVDVGAVGAAGVELRSLDAPLPDRVRAGVVAHRFNPKLVGLTTRVYTGWLQDGVYAPHTEGGFRAPANKTLLLVANGAMAKRGVRASPH